MDDQLQWRTSFHIHTAIQVKMGRKSGQKEKKGGQKKKKEEQEFVGQAHAHSQMLLEAKQPTVLNLLFHTLSGRITALAPDHTSLHFTRAFIMPTIIHPPSPIPHPYPRAHKRVERNCVWVSRESGQNPSIIFA